MCNNNFYLNLLHTKNSKCIIKQHKKEETKRENAFFLQKGDMSKWRQRLLPVLLSKRSGSHLANPAANECTAYQCRLMRVAVVSGKGERRMGGWKRIERQPTTNKAIRIQNYVYEVSFVPFYTQTMLRRCVQAGRMSISCSALPSCHIDRSELNIQSICWI